MSFFIIESAIYQEADIIKKAPDKAYFRMVMQTLDEVNQNKRIYPSKVVKEAMEECKERIKKRALSGELDHPIPTSDSQFNSIRQTSVLLKEVSHIVRDYEFRGNLLVGELETTRTTNGRELLGLLYDKVGIGLSMRGLADDLERQGEHNIVRGPLVIIAYDAVSRPSHQAAIVNFNEVKFESAGILTESSNLICLKEGYCFLPNYFDKLVEKEIIRLRKQWI